MYLFWWLKHHTAGVAVGLGAVLVLGVALNITLRTSASKQAQSLGDPSAPRPSALAHPTAAPAAYPKPKMPEASREEAPLAAVEQALVAAYNCAQAQRGAPALVVDPALSQDAASILNGERSEDTLPLDYVMRDVLALDTSQPAVACSVGGVDLAAFPAAEGVTRLGFAARTYDTYGGMLSVVVLGK